MSGIKFSNTTPPAPVGRQLVAFQADGQGNVSASVPTGGGGSSFTVVTTAVNYTANPLDDIWASGTINITSPPTTSGNRFKVTNRSTGTITVLPASGLISGQASYQLKRQYTSIELVSDGVNWAIE